MDIDTSITTLDQSCVLEDAPEPSQEDTLMKDDGDDYGKSEDSDSSDTSMLSDSDNAEHSGDEDDDSFDDDAGDGDEDGITQVT